MKTHALTILAMSAAFASGTAVANDFVTQRFEKNLDVPAKVAWAKIGGFCQIDVWMSGMKCVYASGTGDIGTVRDMEWKGAKIREVIVGKTPLSYTYISVPAALPDYHGTMTIQPTGAKTSKITYTFLWDQETLTPEQRKKEHDLRVQLFNPALDDMKKAAETK